MIEVHSLPLFLCFLVISYGQDDGKGVPWLAASDSSLNPCTLVDSKCLNKLIIENETETEILRLQAFPVSLRIVNATLHRSECVPKLRLRPSERCQRACATIKYPTLDGTCNNVEKPTLGAAFTPLGINLPNNFSHGELPSPRRVSRFLQSIATTYSSQHNQMVMQWGQFITHDILKMTVKPNDTFCLHCSKDPNYCLQLPMSLSDFNSQKFGCQFGKNCCIRETPAAKICEHNSSFLNENTAFVDASHVYGCSERDLQKWFLSETSPFLKTVHVGNEDFMPGEVRNCTVSSRSRFRGKSIDRKCKAKFRAGDDRVNVFVGLGAFHNVFLREHNRIVNVLRDANKRCWNGEKLFFETRKILSAMMQKITYDEWLPKLFGRDLKSYEGYKSDLKPRVTTDVSAAALRIGHAMIDGIYPFIDRNGFEFDRLSFVGTLKNSERLIENADEFVRGMIFRPNRNPIGVKDEVGNELFHSRDLPAINIARAREMGIPKYRVWRRYCGFSDIPTFRDLKTVIDRQVNLERLQGLYSNNTDNIDLFVGLLIEKQSKGAILGETASCLLQRQFQLLRDGDRFWYENNQFSPSQLESLNSISLSQLLCANLNRIRAVPRDAFRLSQLRDLVDCERIPPLDLKPWFCTKKTVTRSLDA